jgi:1-acyl-sn-glycerol-3-phosphate acyltransferase
MWERFRLLIRMVPALIVMILATVVIGSLIILISPVSSGGPAYRLMVWWARIVSKALGISCSVEGGSGIEPGTSYIVAPNHQSIADILPVLCAIPVRFRWVLKQELLHIPLFGWGLSAAGAVGLDRSNSRKSVEKMQEAQHTLKGGWSLLVYPEGTTTWDGTLLPFKKGAFIMALRKEVPILPVTTNGAFKILPRGARIVRPGHVTVTIGDPIPTKGLEMNDLPDLMEKTRTAIGKHLDPNYDPFNIARFRDRNTKTQGH